MCSCRTSPSANGWGPGPGAHRRDSASAHAGRGSDQTGAKKGGARSTMECLRVRPTGSPRASRCRTSELRHMAANTVKMIGDSANGTEVFAGRSARCSSPGVLSTETTASGWLTGWAGRTDASSELVGVAPSRQESGARGPTETAAAAATASAATRAARRIRTTVQGYLSSRSWSLSGSADLTRTERSAPFGPQAMPGRAGRARRPRLLELRLAEGTEGLNAHPQEVPPGPAGGRTRRRRSGAVRATPCSQEVLP